jgi:hypothetical protein
VCGTHRDRDRPDHPWPASVSGQTLPILSVLCTRRLADVHATFSEHPPRHCPRRQSSDRAPEKAGCALPPKSSETVATPRDVLGTTLCRCNDPTTERASHNVATASASVL